jgi:ferredoxin
MAPPRDASPVRRRPSRSDTQAPVSDNALCIGCGICENKCPVVDEPAIYVTSVGEVRSKTNQLLLPLIGQEPPQQ